jgi:hypothetical protein
MRSNRPGTLRQRIPPPLSDLDLAQAGSFKTEAAAFPVKHGLGSVEYLNAVLLSPILPVRVRGVLTLYWSSHFLA